MDYIGQYAVIHLVLHVVCICIAYWALQSIRLDQFFKRIRHSITSVYDICCYFIRHCSKQFYCRFVTILDAGKIFNKISLTL